MMASQVQAQEARSGSSRGLPELKGAWPRVAQVIWVGLLLLVVYILFFRLQQTMAQAHQLCKLPNCQGAQTTREEARLVHQMGLSVVAYGLYTVALIVFIQAVFSAVGAITIWRRPSDPMAVLTAFTLLLFGSVTISSGVPPGLPAFLDFPIQVLGLIGSYALLAFFYLFPDGRLVIRWPLLLAAPEIVFQAAQYLAPNTAFNPTVSPGNSLASKLLFWTSFFAFIVALASVVYVQIYRYRKVSTLAERQQTKWVVYGTSAALTGYILGVLSFGIPGLWASAVVQVVLGTFNSLVLTLIPLSIGIAILRYRLWEVDVLINRTLVYGLLTALLATLYVGSVVLLQAVFRALTGQGSGLAVAISTLAIAALFQPLRRGTQSFIDQRFYRRKYDAARTLARFAERVRDDVNLDELTGDIVSVVHETMEPTHVSLWLKPSGASEEAGT